MNKLTSIILNCTLALAVSAPAYASTPIFQTGDLITQTSKSRQSRFIRAATGSPYTHIGMIVNKEGKQQVIEAVEPEKFLLCYDTTLGPHPRCILQDECEKIRIN